VSFGIVAPRPKPPSNPVVGIGIGFVIAIGVGVKSEDPAGPAGKKARGRRARAAGRRETLEIRIDPGIATTMDSSSRASHRGSAPSSGLLFPARIENWPAREPRRRGVPAPQPMIRRRPLGFSHEEGGRDEPDSPFPSNRPSVLISLRLCVNAF
jgi:hypothetical protein